MNNILKTVDPSLVLLVGLYRGTQRWTTASEAREKKEKAACSAEDLDTQNHKVNIS